MRNSQEIIVLRPRELERLRDSVGAGDGVDLLEACGIFVSKFAEGDVVHKITGDYVFRGVVVAVFLKRKSPQVRVCVENSDGSIHIFSPSQLSHVDP